MKGLYLKVSIRTLYLNGLHLPFKIKLLSDINAVEKAKRENKLNMNIQTIVENLAFDLIL